MSEFKLVTDSTADLPEDYIRKHNLGILNLTCIFEGETYGKDKKLDYKFFYKKEREGSLPTTSQVNPEDAKESFREYLKENKKILYIAFSSGLSGTCSNVGIAARELMEEEDCEIVVIDSLCASLGEGLLVHKAVVMMEEGKSMEETAKWVEDNKQHLVHMFTVDDLNHLYRGGRVSKTAAVLGTMINIKPILHVDEEGHLIPVGKVRGRKKSLHTLVDYMEQKMGSYKEQNDVIFISHGDCEEDAEFVRGEVEKRFGIHAFLIDMVGPVIGSHSGPGTLALFFMGEER